MCGDLNTIRAPRCALVSVCMDNVKTQEEEVIEAKIFENPNLLTLPYNLRVPGVAVFPQENEAATSVPVPPKWPAHLY